MEEEPKNPVPPPPGKTPVQALGQRIGMGICVLFGILVAVGPGVEKSQRILGLLFALACGVPLLWVVLRNR